MSWWIIFKWPGFSGVNLAEGTSSCWKPGASWSSDAGWHDRLSSVRYPLAMFIYVQDMVKLPTSSTQVSQTCRFNAQPSFARGWFFGCADMRGLLWPFSASANQPGSGWAYGQPLIEVLLCYRHSRWEGVGSDSLIVSQDLQYPFREHLWTQWCTPASREISEGLVWLQLTVS